MAIPVPGWGLCRAAKYVCHGALNNIWTVPGTAGEVQPWALPHPEGL